MESKNTLAISCITASKQFWQFQQIKYCMADSKVIRFTTVVCGARNFSGGLGFSRVIPWLVPSAVILNAVHTLSQSRETTWELNFTGKVLSPRRLRALLCVHRFSTSVFAMDLIASRQRRLHQDTAITAYLYFRLILGLSLMLGLLDVAVLAQLFQAVFTGRFILLPVQFAAPTLRCSTCRRVRTEFTHFLHSV